MSDRQWPYQVSEWSYGSATGAVGRGTLPLNDQTKADYTDMFMVLTGAPNGHEAVTTASFSHFKGLTDLLTQKDSGYADETLDLSALGGGVYLDIYKVKTVGNLSPWIKSGRAQYGLGDGNGEIKAESLGMNIATITGTGHDDFILGSERSEIISGGDGNDILAGRGRDHTILGGDGTDTVNYSTATGGVTVSLADDTQNAGGAAGDSFTSIEQVLGSSFNDIITGDGNNNFLAGNGGTDSLTGGGGADTFAFNLTGSDAGTATITDFALTDNDTIFIQTASGTDTASLTSAGLAIITGPNDSANAQLVDATDNATIYAIFEDLTSTELLTTDITLVAL